MIIALLVLAAPVRAATDSPTGLPVPPGEASIEDYRQAIDGLREHLQASPGDYQANWTLARLLREYAKRIKEEQREGWKEACARLGKEGMDRAEKASSLRPDRPEGYYYFGLNAGVYADGAGVVNALSEGLRTKTREAFEKAYQLDPSYDNGAPLLALAHYWASLPWPLKDGGKALKYCREYQSSEFYPEVSDGPIQVARILIKIDTKDSKNEARALLQNVIAGGGPQLAKKAEHTLSKIR